VTADLGRQLADNPLFLDRIHVAAPPAAPSLLNSQPRRTRRLF
jgi:hypothetical protein